MVPGVNNVANAGDLYRNECKLGVGATPVIVSICLMFFVGIMTCSLRDPADRQEMEEEEKSDDMKPEQPPEAAVEEDLPKAVTE